MNYSKNLTRFLPFLLLPLIFFGIDYLTGKKTAGYWAYIIASVFLLAIAVFLFIRSKQQQKILREGIQGKAKILAMEDTGRQINWRPQLRIKLLVSAPGIEPYEVDHLESVDYYNMTKLQIGSDLNVMVDENKPGRLVIKWQDNP